MALILKRAPIGWDQDDFDVVENGVIVGRIFKVPAIAPQDHPWMWASGHNGTPRDAQIRRNARSGDGGVREELAAGSEYNRAK
jgi:hypothetical protein